MKTALKVALGIVLGMTVLIVGCVALLGAGVEEADKEQRKKGITLGQFKAQKAGKSQAAVKGALGKPENAQQFEAAGVKGLTSKSSCIYYPERGKGIGEGRSFQLCFTEQKLDSKNVY